MPNLLHASFFIGIGLFAFTLIFQTLLFQQKQQRKFNFRNELPFELVQGVDQKYLSYHYILLFLVTLAEIIFAYNYFPQLILWYEYLLVGSFVLSSIMVYILYFVRVFEVKRHIIVMLIQALSVITSYFALGVFAQFNIWDKQVLALAIVLYIIAFVALLALLHPKLRRWPIMDKEFMQDGTVVITRPRYFMLAVYEWMFILLHFIVFIIMYIYLYV